MDVTGWDGKVTKEEVIMIENCIYPRWQYEEFAEAGYFGKNAHPFVATHVEIIEWEVGYSFLVGEKVVRPKSREIIENEKVDGNTQKAAAIFHDLKKAINDAERKRIINKARRLARKIRREDAAPYTLLYIDNTQIRSGKNFTFAV